MGRILTLILLTLMMDCHPEAPAPPSPKTSQKGLPSLQKQKSPQKTLRTFFFLAPDATLKPYPFPVQKGDYLTASVMACLQVYCAMEPPQGLISPFPTPCNPKAFYLLEGGEGVLDLSCPDLKRSFGSQDELTLMDCLVNTVILNFPQVRSLKVLVNGKEDSLLFNHLPQHLFFKPKLP